MQSPLTQDAAELIARRFLALSDPTRLRVASRRRGDHRVRIVATAGGRTDRVVLVARGL